MRNAAVCVGLLAVSVAACTHMTAVAKPADFVTTKKPARVWVTGVDNAEVLVMHPAVHGDTLSGFADQKFFEMPMTDVKLIRASVPSGQRTALFAGATAVVLGVAVATAGGGKKACTPAPGTQDAEGDALTPC